MNGDKEDGLWGAFDPHTFIANINPHEWLGSFELSPYDKKVYDLALDYITECDDYDSSICSHCNYETGEPVFTTKNELALSDRFSRNKKKDILENNPDVTWKDISKWFDVLP